MTGEGSFLEFAPVDQAAAANAARAQNTDGYFELPGAIPPNVVRRMNDAIDAVVAAGWPPAFVFVYDEAWLAARAPGLSQVLNAVLGPGYLQICHVWIHVVKAAAGATGWSPHTDGHANSNPRGRLSVWIGLTDSTIDNGCMHVIPRRAAATPPDLLSRFHHRDAQFDRAEVASLLHAAHALVSAPGDALGWGFDIIHWGGPVRRAAHERRAFSFEFVSASVELEETDGAVIPNDTLPAFDARLRAVATGLIAYRRFEPIIDRFADVAHSIKDRLS